MGKEQLNTWCSEPGVVFVLCKGGAQNTLQHNYYLDLKTTDAFTWGKQITKATDTAAGQTSKDCKLNEKEREITCIEIQESANESKFTELWRSKPNTQLTTKISVSGTEAKNVMHGISEVKNFFWKSCCFDYSHILTTKEQTWQKKYSVFLTFTQYES